jgi:uncharacterized membrane protein YhiD involved in acid resistance
MTIPISLPSLPISTEKSVEQSYLRSLAQVIAQIFTACSEIAHNDHQEIVQLERQYTSYSQDAAGLMRSRGNWEFGAAIVSIAVFAAAFSLPNAADQKIARFAAQKIPDLLKLLDARKESLIKMNESIASLKMTHLQDKNNNKVQPDIDRFVSVLQEEIQHRKSIAAN